MASQTTTETSGRITTHMRGRIFKFAPKAKGQRIVSKERRRICVLTDQGARELEHWNQSQPCFGPGCHHRHQTREAVEKLVACGYLRWVGVGHNVAAHVEGRKWKPTISDGHTVMQLV